MEATMEVFQIQLPHRTISFVSQECADTFKKEVADAEVVKGVLGIKRPDLQIGEQQSYEAKGLPILDVLRS